MEMFSLLFGIVFWPIVIFVWIRACRAGRVRRVFRYIGHVAIFGSLALVVFSMAFYCLVQEPLCQEASDGNAVRVQQLLRWRANPNEDFEGSFPILCAAEAGHLEVVRILLVAGADPNTGRDCGYSALHAAKAHGYKDIAEVLRKAGAVD